MPKLNRWLITSIIEDIKEFISVANEMCSWIGKVEHSSWRYPRRSARNVNAMAIVEHHKGSAGEMYILLLEMAYDRMHFVLRLVVEFMDSYPFIEEFFKDVSSDVKRPKNMSLANVIRTLWHRLKLVPETITRNMLKTKHLENPVFPSHKSFGCQVSGSLFYCESCSFASKTVKELTNIISTVLQGNNLSSAILAERELIRIDHLFEKTQWTVMTKLVDAINSDIKTLLNSTSAIRAKAEADAKEHEKCSQSFLAELEKQRSDKSLLEMEFTKTMDHLHAVDDELHKLKDTQMELVRENRALTESLYEANKKLSNSEMLLAVTLRQMAEVSEAKVALENAVKHLHDEVTAVREFSSIETEELRKNLNDLRDEKVLREKEFSEELESLKQKNVEDVEKLREEEDKSKLKSASENMRVNSFSMKEAETQTDFEEQLRFGEYEIGEEILVPKGDPEIDMTQQLASNKNTIDKLTRQNERLSKTLTRLKDHRKISEICTIINVN